MVRHQISVPEGERALGVISLAEKRSSLAHLDLRRRWLLPPPFESHALVCVAASAPVYSEVMTETLFRTCFKTIASRQPSSLPPSPLLKAFFCVARALVSNIHQVACA